MVGRAETLSAVFFLSAFFAFRLSANPRSRGIYLYNPVSQSCLTGFPYRFDQLVLDGYVSTANVLLCTEQGARPDSNGCLHHVRLFLLAESE